MAEEKPEQTQGKAKRGKKINKMKLAEIEKSLEEVKGAQGGLSSRHARQLLRRKAGLSSSKS